MATLRQQLSQLISTFVRTVPSLKQMTDSDLVAPVDQRLARQTAVDGPDTHVRSAGARLGQVNPLWVTFIAGGVFAGASVGLVFLTLYVQRTQAEATPVWALGAFAAVSGLVGVAVLISAVHQAAARLSRRAAIARNPGQPWHGDYAWDATGATDNHSRTTRRHWAIVVIMAAVLVPAHVLTVRLALWGPAVADGAVFFLVPFLAIWDLAFYIALRRARRISAEQALYGRSRLRFTSFPFFLGGMCRVALESEKSLGACRRLTLTLRAVRERRIVTASMPITSRRSRTYALVADQLWADHLTVEGADRLQPGAPVALEFQLPADPSLATCLAADPPQYWELLAAGQSDGDAGGPDYHARFLVPVYAQPSAAGA